MPDKVESALVREKVTDYFPDGRIRTVEQIVLRRPLDTGIADMCIEESFTSPTPFYP
jgi:hypothetical protein